MVAASPSAQQTARVYTLIDLGTLGGASSEASGINLFGDVVGSAQTAAGARHAFLYRTGRMFDLGTLEGGTSSAATAIADDGTIAGYSGINAYGPMFDEFTQGFLWRNGVMSTLGALYCPCSFNRRYGTSRALALNNSGIVVGDSMANFYGLTTHAFVWANALQDIGGVVDRLSSSTAYGINGIGEIAGVIDGQAFVRRGDSLRFLPAPAGYARSEAHAINARGQVAGVASTAGGVRTAVLWDLNAARPLGNVPGAAASEALAINADGAMVGRAGNVDLSESRAVLWQDGAVIDLNAVVSAFDWRLTVAAAINDVGQIAGTGILNGQRRAFLLIPL